MVATGLTPPAVIKMRGVNGVILNITGSVLVSLSFVSLTFSVVGGKGALLVSRGEEVVYSYIKKMKIDEKSRSLWRKCCCELDLLSWQIEESRDSPDSL